MPESAIPPMLRRDDLARALTEHGFPISKATLETMASRGGGPAFRRFGRAVLYPWPDAIAWAEGRASPLVRSTAELRRRAA